jgi:hypothetical protein
VFGDYILAEFLREKLQVSNDYEQIKAMSNDVFESKTFCSSSYSPLLGVIALV